MNRVLDLLLGDGQITADMAMMIRSYMERWQVSAYKAILETHVLDEQHLADGLARLLGFNRIYLIEVEAIPEQALQAVPYPFAKVIEAIPVDLGYADGQPKLELVVADPTALKRLQTMLPEFQLQVAVGERSEILKAIDEAYDLKKQIPHVFCQDASTKVEHS